MHGLAQRRLRQVRLPLAVQDAYTPGLFLPNRIQTATRRPRARALVLPKIVAERCQSVSQLKYYHTRSTELVVRTDTLDLTLITRPSTGRNLCNLTGERTLPKLYFREPRTLDPIKCSTLV